MGVKKRAVLSITFDVWMLRTRCRHAGKGRSTRNCGRHRMLPPLTQKSCAAHERTWMRKKMKPVLDFTIVVVSIVDLTQRKYGKPDHRALLPMLLLLRTSLSSFSRPSPGPAISDLSSDTYHPKRECSVDGSSMAYQIANII